MVKIRERILQIYDSASTGRIIGLNSLLAGCCLRGAGVGVV